MNISDNILPKEKKNSHNTSNSEELLNVLNSDSGDNNIKSNGDQYLKLINKDYHSMELSELYLYSKELLNQQEVQKIIPIIREIQDIIRNKIQEDKEQGQELFKKKLEPMKSLVYEDSIWERKFKDIFFEFKKKIQFFYQEKEKQLQKNHERRKQIIEDLKSLYTSPYGANNQIFKRFREIKTNWNRAGMVPKNEADSLFKTYFHHLDNFYSYLNLNKELQEMDYAHNLDQRKLIINRAKNLLLLEEGNLFKSLNELQYLHKLWREEAEPVAPEHKESTWNEFKDITSQIHEKKNDWILELQNRESKNLEIKNQIIRELNDLITQQNTYISHKSLQETIKNVDSLRQKFIETGKVPKEYANSIWTQFKEVLKDFTYKKNEFYKTLKNEQIENLKRKNKLIEIANSNKDSEDWNTALEIFKKIQSDWKKTGHVPKKLSDKKWDEFQSACNYFFDRYKNKHKQNNDEFKQNLLTKRSILDELDLIKFDEKKDKDSTIEKIKQLSHKWNQIGKVPRENININSVFLKLCKEIFNTLKINSGEIAKLQIELQFENIISTNDEKKLNEELRKLKKQIQELENDIAILENNLSFFSNAGRSNPLVKDSYERLERKQQNVKNLKEDFQTLSRLELNGNRSSTT